jgi:hypothetical protein
MEIPTGGEADALSGDDELDEPFVFAALVINIADWTILMSRESLMKTSLLSLFLRPQQRLSRSHPSSEAYSSGGQAVQVTRPPPTPPVAFLFCQISSDVAQTMLGGPMSHPLIFDVLPSTRILISPLMVKSST